MLLDSFAFVYLAKFIAIILFNIEEEKKRSFLYLCNRPEFWSYFGQIPHLDYYEPDTLRLVKENTFQVVQCTSGTNTGT